jgi:lysozyme
VNLEPLRELVRRYEGLRLKPYLCPAGKPTIGYGHTGAEVRLGSPPISVGFAEMLMEEDITKFARAALKLSPILATEDEKLCAVADFCFNLGTGRYKASTLKRKVDAGEWDDAADELSKWVWGGGRKLPGLVARRAAEARLMIGG